MEQVIEPARQHDVPPGEPHHFLDLTPVLGMVAVAGAVFARGLGIHRSVRPLDQRMSQQVDAGRAKLNVFIGQGGNVERLHPRRGFSHAAVSLSTVDGHEPNERPQVSLEMAVRELAVLVSLHTWRKRYQRVFLSSENTRPIAAHRAASYTDSPGGSSNNRPVAEQASKSRATPMCRFRTATGFQRPF